jgi:beta-glucosidase
MIAAIAAANKRTVVVLKDGGPVLMPWIDAVPAVLEAWFPGQEDGNIVADLLFGLANPSGKLPVTYPRAEADVPAHTQERWPGVKVDGKPTVVYSEGLQVGYRWFDAQSIPPLFPFGYGLSYTTFSVSDLSVSPVSSDGKQPISVSFSVRNTGHRRGGEVPQVYAGFPAGIGEPPKRLVAFGKVWLDPGEERRVTFTIDPQGSSHPLSVWDKDAQRWTVVAGDVLVSVGASSAELALRNTIAVHAPGPGNELGR